MFLDEANLAPVSVIICFLSENWDGGGILLAVQPNSLSDGFLLPVVLLGLTGSVPWTPPGALGQDK